MISVANVGAAASSAQECADLAAAAEPAALAISFDSITGACKYSTSIYSYATRYSGYEPSFYLRTDNVMKNLSDPDCLTRQDAEYLIAKLSFGDEQCSPSWSSYDASSGLCTGTAPYGADLGRYDAGRLPNGTQYLMSRDIAIESIGYKCYFIDFPKIILNGTWYCYGSLIAGNASTALMKDNKCEAELGSGWAPVKITEPREYGFAYKSWTPFYLGLYLQTGTTYVWYDGSAATDLPWASGRPLGDPTKDMVYVTSNYTVTPATCALSFAKS